MQARCRQKMHKHLKDLKEHLQREIEIDFVTLAQDTLGKLYGCIIQEGNGELLSSSELNKIKEIKEIKENCFFVSAKCNDLYSKKDRPAFNDQCNFLRNYYLNKLIPVVEKFIFYLENKEIVYSTRKPNDVETREDLCREQEDRDQVPLQSNVRSVFFSSDEPVRKKRKQDQVETSETSSPVAEESICTGEKEEADAPCGIHLLDIFPMKPIKSAEIQQNEEEQNFFKELLEEFESEKNKKGFAP